MNISVLLVVRNEQAHILECLRSLLRQSLRPQEILIIDHFSDDLSFSIIKDFKKAHPELNIKAVQRSGNHLGRSRQELLSLSAHPWVAFIDGDCEAPKNWLKQLAEGLKLQMQLSPRVVGVGGPNRLPRSTEVHQAINLALDSVLGSFSKSPQAYRPKAPVLVHHLATTNSLFVKSELFRVGGFSANFPLCGEDLDLGLRLTDKKMEVVLLPEPIVINHCANNFGEWLARMFRFGQAQAQIFILRGWSKPMPLAALLLLPLLISFFVLGTWIPAVSKAIAFYLLFSLVFAYLHSGLKASTRLGLALWISLHLSPLAYSLGLWTVLLLRLQKKLTANVFSHLKTGPSHALSLCISMFQRLRQIGTNSH